MKHLLSILSAALAAVAVVASADEGAARSALKRVFPQSPIEGLLKTPIPGLLEAAVDGQVFYVTEDGRYILAGPLLDVQGNRNLTEARLEKINVIAFDSLPLAWAIKRVKGSGARRLAIFEDPDCPYCKTLEQTLAGIDNVAVFVFLYPIDQIHPDAAEKSKAVWCATDRARAWDDIMRTGVVPANSADCDNPIAKIADFARQHRITGTPTTILSDGRRLVGAVPRAELEQYLLKAARP